MADAALERTVTTARRTKIKVFLKYSDGTHSWGESRVEAPSAPWANYPGFAIAVRSCF